MRSSARFTLLVGALAIAGALSARAQEGGLGGPDEGADPTEAQVKACPRLAGATGRRKNQLMALYFQLDWAKPDEAKEKVAKLFDFERAEDKALLEGVLLEKGPRPQARGLRALVAASNPGLVWLMGEFDKAQAQPSDLGVCVDAVFAARSKEAIRFLERCLDDPRPVPDTKAAQEAPPGYQHLRVCDHALRVLRARFESWDKLTLPKDPMGEVRSLTPVAKRDASIASFKKWLAEDKGHQELLAKAPSALEGLPEDKKKEAQDLLKKLKVEDE
jgi:hypothetical protein